MTLLRGDRSRTEDRHFLRSVVAAKPVLSVGEPVRVRVKLKRDSPDDLALRIGGAVGPRRYVSFDAPGIHSVPVTVQHPDGRTDRTTIDFDVVPAIGHPYPILDVRQEPTNPFLLQISLRNAASVHREGVAYEWRIDEYGSFVAERPFVVVDCERLLNPTDVVVSFDLHFTAVYPDGTRRTARESFRVWNDYAWFKTRGILKPRLAYDFRARGAKSQIAATCTIVNDDDEVIQITGRQIEILFGDADRVFVPGPLEALNAVVEPRTRREFECSIPRSSLPEDAIGYAVHLHGTTRTGLKVEASAYFEYYRYTLKYWSDITNLEAVDLLLEAKAAYSNSRVAEQTPLVTAGFASVANLTHANAPVAQIAKDSSNLRVAASGGVPDKPGQLSIAAIRAFVEAIEPISEPGKVESRRRGLAAIIGGRTVMAGDADAFYLGRRCLPDEEPPSSDLVCKDSGQRGQVFVPARIMNGKKGDVLLLPGGPLGFIGGLLQKLTPPQNFSHCGIMTGNFYKLRHATASGDWLFDELLGQTFLAPDDVGTDAIRPESLKYIWPGTIDQSVEEAFHGSNFKYTSADGNRQKMYRIQAFSADPSFFLNQERHVVFPLVLKPDPLLEGDPTFAHLRPTLSKVADQAKSISGHYRFFCYSNGEISMKSDATHRAPDRGPAWWASSTRPVVCSTLVQAAITDLDDPRVRIESRGAFATEADLEKVAASGADGPDKNALVDDLTRDGLYLYTAEERKDAGNFLYGHVYQEALKKSGSLGRFFTDAPDDFANQVANAFAYDYTDREFDDEDAKDSDKWKEPGTGRSVSPDDMLIFWDAPTASPDGVHGLYGSAQRMVFRDGFVEEREIGTWAKREKIGKLKVIVTRGASAVPGADVKVGGQVVVTNGQGTATLDLPEGKYSIEVGVFMNGLFFEGRGSAQVKDQATVDAAIDLVDPPEFKRLVVIGGHVRIKDEENVGSDEIFDDSFTPSPNPIRLGPNERKVSTSYVKKFGGEIRVEARYDLTWNADLSVTVDCNVKLFEGVSEDTGDLDGEKGDTVTVAKDQQAVPLKIYVRNDQEDDDDYVQLDALISNYVDI